MSDTPTSPDDVDPDERAIAEMLVAKRPTPAAAFRGALARRIRSVDPGYGPRPANLWTQVLGFAAGGTALIVIGALIGLGRL